MGSEDPQSISNATWVKVEESIRTGRVTKIILPLGSLEQHGPHLPLSTDTVIAEFVAREVVKRCTDAFLMPPIYLGCSGEHLGFPGTVSLQAETMAGIILDLSSSLLKSKLNKLFIINGHGGNRAIIDSTLAKIKQEFPEMRAYSFTIMEIVKQKYDKVRKSPKRLVGHADEIETSMMLAIQPNVVDMSKAVSEKPELPAAISFEPEDLARVSFGWNARELSKSGIVGNPLLANAATGKLLLDYAVDTVSAIINEL